VNALQAKGEVVAMTGDGVNDAPAIKTADIGISLGTGTDIAKETADIILLDNNFKTIVMAVHEGRVIFSNIRKVATYLLSDSFSEMLIITGSIIFGLPLAILPTQILWINIVNDGLPNFSLAFEKDDNNAMSKKPLKKNENFINKEMKILIFGVGLVRDSLIFLLFVLLFANGHDINYLRSLFFVILAVKSLFSIFSLRSFTKPIWKINPFSNHFLLAAATINILLVIAAIYWKPLQIILSTTPLNKNGWVIVILVGILSVLITEFGKSRFIKKTT
jgi:Ca2+-transporting ATPase